MTKIHKHTGKILVLNGDAYKSVKSNRELHTASIVLLNQSKKDQILFKHRLIPSGWKIIPTH